MKKHKHMHIQITYLYKIKPLSIYKVRDKSLQAETDLANTAVHA